MNTNLSPGLRLTPLREKAAQLIAEGGSQAETSRELHISKTTINKWCKNPEFKDRINQLRSDSVMQAKDILEMSIPDAARTVVELAAGNLQFEDPKELNPRLRAALYILERFAKEPRTNKAKQTSKYRPQIDEELDDLIKVANDGHI